MAAGNMWGNGIYRATSDIMDIMGPERTCGRHRPGR